MKYELPAIAAACWFSVVACAGGDPTDDMQEGDSPEPAAASQRTPRAGGGATPEGEGPVDRRVVSGKPATGAVEGSNTNWLPWEPPPPPRSDGDQRPTRVPKTPPPEPQDPNESTPAPAAGTQTNTGASSNTSSGSGEAGTPNPAP